MQFKPIIDIFKDYGFKQGLQQIGESTKDFLGTFTGQATMSIGATYAMYKTIQALSDAYNLSYDSAMKNMSEHLEGLNSTKSEIENLKSQTEEYKTTLSSLGEKYNVDLSGIDSIDDKISALQNSGKIELIDQVEIDKISEANSKLESQLSIKERLSQSQQEETASNAKEALKRGKQSAAQQVAQQVPGGKKTYQGMVSNVNVATAVKEDIVAIEKYENKVSDLEKSMSELDPKSKEWKQSEKDIASYNKAIEKLTEDLDSKEVDLDKLLSAISVNGEGLEALKGFEDEFKEVKSAYDAINTIDLSPTEKHLSQIESYFNGSSTSNSIKDSILQMLESGEVDNATDALHKMGVTLNDLGITGEGRKAVFDDYFKGLVDSAQEAEKTVKSIDGSFEEVKAAFESENQDANWKSMSDLLMQAGSLYKEGKIGTDDFQSAVQFISPKEINPDSTKFDAQAYAKAYEKYKDKIYQYFNSDDELQSAQNLQDDLISKGLAKETDNGIDWTKKFNSSADAAKAWGISVEAAEVAMHNLESYGAEFDHVMFSGEGLKRYQSALEQIQTIYDGMGDDSNGKERLGKVLELANKEDFENNLENLTEDQVIKIEFEYDLASLQQQINDLKAGLMEGGGSTEQYAELISVQRKRRDLLESDKGLSKAVKNDGYQNAGKAYNDLGQKLITDYDMGEEARRNIQQQQSAMLDLQNTYLDLFSNGDVIDWNSFLKTKEAENIFDQLAKDTGGKLDNVKKELLDIMGIDIDAKEVDIKAKDEASDTINKVNSLEILEKITRLVGQDEATPVLTLWNTLSADPKFSKLSAEDQASYVVQVWNSLTPEQKEAFIRGEIEVVDNSAQAAQSAEKNLTSLPLNPQGKITAKDLTSDAVSSATSALNKLDGKTAHTYIFTHKKTDGKGKLNGTAHASGTAKTKDINKKTHGLYPIPKLSGRALATGTLQDDSWLKNNWKTKNDENALTGEEGQEMVVYGNRWWTVGDNGAEFNHIPAGSIVFNAKQTKELLKNGSINSRGKALLGGTAYGDGMPSIGSNISSSTSNSSSTNFSPKSSDDKSKKKSKQTFDWIARKLERLQQMIDLTKVKFENLFTLKKKSSNLDNQIKKTNTLLKANRKAAKAYGTYASKVDLSASLKKKVQSGNYSIKDYGEKTAEKINKYKDYYDKRKESEKQVHELTTAIRELKEQKYQLYVDRAESQIERYDAAIDAGTNYKQNNKYVNTQIAQTKESYKYQIKIAKLANDTIKVKQLEAEREQAVIDLQKKKFDNIQTYYENQVSLLNNKQNAIQNQVDLLEAKGMTVSSKYYSDQINSEKQKRTQLQKSKKELEEQLKNVKKGTEEWYDCKFAIADVSSEISDCNKSIAEMNTSITELADNYHEKMIKVGDTIMETMDWAVSLMDNVNMFDSNTSDITKEGLSTLGSYVSNYHTSSEMADRDKKLIENLEKNYKNGTLSFIDSNGYRRNYNSLEQFKASIDETYESWREQISTTYDYESKIIDMMRDKLKNEMSALQELIDAKKEALRAEKDLHDYQKNIQEKTKDISTIQKQIAAYSGDTSQEGLAKLQKLQSQLSEKEDNLRETEYDKYISDQEEMLDKLYEEYDKSVTSELQNVEKLLQDGIEIAKATSNQIAEILKQYTNKYDYEGKHDNLDTGINNITNPSDIIGFLLKNNANEWVKTPFETALESSTVETVSSATKKKGLSAEVTTPVKKTNQSADKETTAKKTNSSSTSKTQQAKPTQGDGKIQVGDKVTFKKGKYYESSKGTGDTGNKNLGKKVYVTKIANGSEYPYCISTSKSSKDGLGWVKKSQLSGFKKGGIARFIKGKGEDGLAMVRNGEGFISPENVKDVQKVFTTLPELNQTLHPLINMNNLPKPIPVNNNTTTIGDTVINIDMPNVTNPNEFIRTLQTNAKIQRAIQACTTDRSVSRGKLGVNEIK